MAYDSIDIAFLLPLGVINSSTPRHYLGVAYIQAYLAKHGFKSVQVMPAFGCTLDDYIDQLTATNAKIVGLTCYDANFPLVKSIAARIKQRNHECIVIAGGPTATFSDELILKNIPDIDLCVRFEGEETTRDLISQISEKTPINELGDIKGITFRRGNLIVRTEDRELFGFYNNEESRLDELPSPYLEGVLNGTEGAGVLSSRGCYHRCTYCNFSAMSKHTIRYHSIDRVIAELRYIQNALDTNSKSGIVNFLDDAFTLNIKRAKNICERIIDEGINLHLACLCRADKVDEEFIELFSQAGFGEIIFGIESAIPRILRNIRKIRNLQSENSYDFGPEENFLQKVKEGIYLAKKYKMKTQVSIILGLPGETYEDGLKTIEFVRNLSVDDYAQNYLIPFPGTELFNTAMNYGIKILASDSILPYRIEYSYPVHEIPFGKNSSVDLCRRMASEAILSAFTGNHDANIGKENGVIITMIERAKDGNFLDAFNWLSKYIALGSGVVIFGKQNDTIQDYNMMLDTSHFSGLPTRRFYYLHNCSSQDTEIIYGLINKPLHGKLQRWNPQFRLINLSKCSESMKIKRTKEDQLCFIYCLNDKKDVYFLASMADKLQQNRQYSAGLNFWMNGIFLDSCRWSRALCPALDMRRVFINEEGEVFPCLTGKALGTLADDLRILREKAMEIFHKTNENRKCNGCSAEFWCSKCLFPYPLEQEEFCELQRANLSMSRIIKRSNVANIMSLK
ncbi:MAG: B12-binding domain-containing radical SAM protein [Methanotrichaceae archaeon]|nr:B12-binding domain-containing radical SAM protein [Methanotrichaceae archaeon]